MTKKRAERKTKHMSNCKKYGTYKSTISQNNNHQAKFKLTQEKNDSFKHKSIKSNDTRDKLYPLQHNKKNRQR